MSPESPEQEADYTLTPRTEAKYSKIDEDFQIMMQRNQQLSGQRVAMSSGNYTLPVSVPIAGGYTESGMLQASPQMAHQNISPRPSSSETDSGNYGKFTISIFSIKCLSRSVSLWWRLRCIGTTKSINF